MGKQEDFDVAIVGGGVSGLICGCYLQKAGLKVGIFEARDEAGGGRMGAEMMRPGYVVQSCIWGDMEPVMMYQLDLGLDRFGYQEQEMIAEWNWGHVFDDGTCLVNNTRDYRKSAEKIRRFSEKDAQRSLDIGRYLDEPFDDKISRFGKLLELIWSAPWTWENYEVLLNMMVPIFGFRDPYEITDLNGFEMLDLLFENEKVKLMCASASVAGGKYPFHTGGGGILALFNVLAMIFSHPRRGTHSLAHVYIRCFRALGGKLFNSCPVRKILVAGGEAVGVKLDDSAAFPGREVRAKKVITNLNPRLTFTELIGEEHVGKKIVQQLKTNWKAEGILFNTSFALKERPHFAAEKFDPDVVQSMTGMMGGNGLIDIIHSHGERFAGRLAGKPIPTYCLAHKDDLSQTSPGNCVANVYIEVPYSIYESGGPEMWDDKGFRRSLAESLVDSFETHSPGFRENVLDYWVTTPTDLERMNPHYLRGCMFGGSMTAPQMWYGNRPGAEGFDKGGIVTPIKNLYGAGGVGIAESSGGNGYRAACHVAEEMGIRNQPWWTHRAGEYYHQKYIAKTYVPAKPTSVLDSDV